MFGAVYFASKEYVAKHRTAARTSMVNAEYKKSRGTGTKTPKRNGKKSTRSQIFTTPKLSVANEKNYLPKLQPLDINNLFNFLPPLP